MRILLFNTLYYPRFVGGAEISVQLLAEALVEEGEQVYVITLGDADETEMVNGVQVNRIKQRSIFPLYDGKKRNSFLKSIWHILDSENPFYHKKITELIAYIKPDIVHTHNIQGFSPVIWRSIKKKNIPLIHTMRDYYLLCHRNNMYNNGCNCCQLCKACQVTHRIKRKFLKFPDVWVGISSFILKKHDLFVQYAPRQKQQVIYNAVNTEEYTIPLKVCPQKVRLGFMGRITEDKGLNYLAQELKKVQQVMPNSFSIYLAGRGEETYISQLTEALEGLDFEFFGVVKPKDFYQKVDVSIVPSKWDEPFGRVVVESLAHHVPVCLAAIGGLKELHNDDCTWLFEPGKSELSELLMEILANRSLIEDKARNSKAHANTFSVRKNVDEHLNLYREIKKARRTLLAFS